MNDDISTRNAQVPATPLVRRLANDFGVALADCSPTGVGGRITAGDVRQTAAADLCSQLWPHPARPDQPSAVGSPPADAVDILWPDQTG
jgi:pyruvate/2-oxoglutarate dehydrogenase complex dihydrolipoamide acyltransferase (E2) component